jgi:hypothetical protein
MTKNPNEKEDHSSKAPLKSDMKAGVQENQQPGVKIPKKGDDEKPKGTTMGEGRDSGSHT